MMPKYNQTRLLKVTFKVKQIEIASRLIQGQTKKNQVLWMKNQTILNKTMKGELEDDFEVYNFEED